METKKFMVKFIVEWFDSNRPELDMREDEAASIYEEVKDQLVLAEKTNDREMLTLIMETFLDTYYSDPVNQVCFELVHEPEFAFITSELKEFGFLYTEEMDGLIKRIKDLEEWFEDLKNDKDLANNEEFKERIRQILRKDWGTIL